MSLDGPFSSPLRKEASLFVVVVCDIVEDKPCSNCQLFTFVLYFTNTWRTGSGLALRRDVPSRDVSSTPVLSGSDVWRDDWSFPMTLYNRGYGSSRRYARDGYGMGGVSLVDDDVKFVLGVGMVLKWMTYSSSFLSLVCFYLFAVWWLRHGWIWCKLSIIAIRSRPCIAFDVFFSNNNKYLRFFASFLVRRLRNGRIRWLWIRWLRWRSK